MSETTTYPEWQHHPFRLTKDEINDPIQVLNNFIRSRNLPEHREVLWAMLSAALTSSSIGFTTSQEASEWVLYCRDLEELREAVFVFGKQYR